MLQHGLPTPTKPTRVVVIGGHGFVGGGIVSAAKAKGINTLSIGRTEVDLLADDATARLASHLHDGDSIVAVSAIAPCKDVGMLVDNMRLVRAIIEAIARVKPAHVVNISSDAVFGDDPLPLNERVPPSPGSLHGAMHLAREIAFQSTITAPLAILRPTLVYGVNDPHNGYGPNRFRRLAAKGEEIVLFGEGEERRDHVLVDDVAEIAVRVLMRRSTGALNIASGEVHSFRAIADQAALLGGHGSRIRGTKRSGPMPHNGYRPFDVGATRAAFPDFTYVPFDEGFRRVTREALGG